MGSLRAVVTAVVAFAALLNVGIAHPGEEYSPAMVKKGIETRDLAEMHAKRVTEKCTGSSTHKALQARAAARRAVTAQLLREKRGIVHSEDSPDVRVWDCGGTLTVE